MNIQEIIAGRPDDRRSPDLGVQVAGVLGRFVRPPKPSPAESFYRQLVALCGLSEQPGVPSPDDAETVHLLATGEAIEVIIEKAAGDPYSARIRFPQEAVRVEL